LKPIGGYSKTFPINCAKSKKIVDQTAKFILENGGPIREDDQEGDIMGSLEALFLMSTGDAMNRLMAVLAMALSKVL